MEHREHPSAAGRAQFVHRSRACECGAIEVPRSVEDQSAVGFTAIWELHETIDNAFRPPWAGRRQLIDCAALMSTAEFRRAIEISGIVEDHTSERGYSVLPSLEAVENLLRPAATGGRQFIHDATAALAAGTAAAVRGGAVDVALSVEGQVAKRGIRAIAASSEGVQHSFPPRAERSLAGSSRRL